MSDKLNFEGYPFDKGPPKGWAVSSLGELGGSIRPGFASGRHNREGDGIPHLRPMNINIRGETDYLEILYVAPDVSPLRIHKGDLLFNNTNSVALVGKTTVIQEDSEYAFSNHMTRIQVNDQFICSEIIAKQLHYLFVAGYFQLHCKRHVNQASISTEFLGHSVPLLIPPLNEQRRIVAKIKDLQGRSSRAREALETVPDLLEQLRQSLLAAAFCGDLTKEWRKKNPDVEPTSELLKRIRAERRKKWEEAELENLKAKGLIGERLDGEFSKRRKQYNKPAPLDTTDLPELPETWCWCLLPEVGYMNRGKSRHRPRNAQHLYGGKYPFVQTGDIAQSNGRIKSHHQTYSEAGLAQSKLWPAGTVCITIAANIASSAILTYPACFPDSVVGINTDKDLCPPEYVEFFIRTVRSELEQFAPATAQKNINIAILNKVVIPLAPRKEVDEILRLLGLSFGNIEGCESELKATQTKLAQLDQSILAKAFRGELVPEDPNDEPASELLGRIRKQRATELAKPRKPSTYGRPIMTIPTKESVIERISQLPNDLFSFEDLKNVVPSDYDSLREIVFLLLEDPDPVVKQVFDKQENAMRFLRRRK